MDGENEGEDPTNGGNCDGDKGNIVDLICCHGNDNNNYFDGGAIYRDEINTVNQDQCHGEEAGLLHGNTSHSAFSDFLDRKPYLPQAETCKMDENVSCDDTESQSVDQGHHCDDIITPSTSDGCDKNDMQSGSLGCSNLPYEMPDDSQACLTVEHNSCSHLENLPGCTVTKNNACQDDKSNFTRDNSLDKAHKEVLKCAAETLKSSGQDENVELDTEIDQTISGYPAFCDIESVARMLVKDAFRNALATLAGEQSQNSDVGDKTIRKPTALQPSAAEAGLHPDDHVHALTDHEKCLCSNETERTASNEATSQNSCITLWDMASNIVAMAVDGALLEYSQNKQVSSHGAYLSGTMDGVSPDHNTFQEHSGSSMQSPNQTETVLTEREGDVYVEEELEAVAGCNDMNVPISEQGKSQNDSSPAANKGNRKKRGRFKKKMGVPSVGVRGRKHKSLAESYEELVPDDSDLPNALSCPVCWDVLYSAQTCRPCDHVFCEPCLRRLAKYCKDAMRAALCPICREPIGFCVKNMGLSKQIEELFPDDYHRRRRTDGRSRFMSHPLPSQANSIQSAENIAQILATRRQQRRHPRVGYTPIRMNVWRFVSFALVFILLKGMVGIGIMFLYNMSLGYVIGDMLMSVPRIMKDMRTTNIVFSWLCSALAFSMTALAFFFCKKMYERYRAA